MSHPLVVVTCDRITHNILNWSGTPAAYLEAAAHVGLLPVQLPTVSEPLDPSALLDVAAGVLVTGSRSNVHPAHYGAEETEEAAPFDPHRDATSLDLITTAVARGIPLLAICRGLQEVNVAFGGTLHPAVHDLPGRHDHRATPQEDVDAWFALAHDVTVTPGGLLEAIVGPGDISVNSAHRQGIETLAPEARIEARAHDGTVEAISLKNARGFALAVQWHPEHFVRTDPPSLAIFDAFAAAARAYQAGERARAA